MPDPVAAIAECTRLLKAGGIFIITSPFASMTHFAPYHFCTGFNKYFYEKHFEGYELLEFASQGSFFTVALQQVMLIPRFCRRYMGIAGAIASIPFVIPLAVFLRITMLFDSNSSELLCFAYFVRARKK